MVHSCIVAGALCEDVVIQGNLSRRGIGGTAYYFPAAFKALGGEAICLSKTRYRWMLDELENRGLPITGISEGSPCGFELAYSGGDRSLRRFRRSSKIGARDLDKEIRSSESFHYGPVEEELDFSLWPLGREFELSTLDVQGLAREFGPDGRVSARTVLTGELAEALNSVKVAKFSEEEATALLGPPSSWSGRIRKLSRGTLETVIVTLGPKGAIVYEEDKEHRVAPYPSKPVDWTGAGDCFMAGYVYRRLEAEDSVGSAKFGSALAALVIETPRPADFPSLEMVLDKMGPD